MLEVRLREGENIEDLLGRFRKMVQRSGLLREFRAHSRFISAGEKARAAARKAARRRLKRERRTMSPGKRH